MSTVPSRPRLRADHRVGLTPWTHLFGRIRQRLGHGHDGIGGQGILFPCSGLLALAVVILDILDLVPLAAGVVPHNGGEDPLLLRVLGLARPRSDRVALLHDVVGCRGVRTAQGRARVLALVNGQVLGMAESRAVRGLRSGHAQRRARAATPARGRTTDLQCGQGVVPLTLLGRRPRVWPASRLHRLPRRTASPCLPCGRVRLCQPEATARPF